MTNEARISTGVAAAALACAAAGIALVLAGGETAVKDPAVLAANAVVAVAFPVVAAAIARGHPGHRLAWVFSGAGSGAAVTLLTYGYARYALEVAPDPLPGGVVTAWVASWVWTTGVMPLVTFGLLLFPDGRLPSRRWRPVAWAAVAAIALMAVAFAVRPGPFEDHPAAVNPLGLTAAEDLLAGVTGVAFVLLVGAALGACAAVVVRWHRGTPPQRRQLRWLLYATAVVAAALAVDGVVASPATSAAVTGAMVVLPVAVGVAIVREQLFDVDVLIGRSLVYGVLTVGVVVTYVVVVAAVGGALGRDAGLAGSLVATGVVAVAFQPGREALQRLVARRVRGADADPYAALTQLARRLETTIEPEAVLPAVVATVATTLRLPYVAVELAGDDLPGPVAAHGTPTRHTTHLSLTHRGQTIGRLVLGRRSDGVDLTRTERRLLEDLARQVGLAVYGVRVTAALQRSRERLVVAREEERRRLHRDLHDGLGPSLAAMTLQLDVLRRLLTEDPEAAATLVGQLKAQLQAAIPEIRRLVDALRPPALDELGLVAALRQQVAALSAPTDGDVAVTVTAPEQLPSLPAATEVAAYRIVLEAVTNVLRHAGAGRCDVRVAYDGALDLEVEDDGCGIPDRPPTGVGLGSMHERAAELGGRCTVGPGSDGGTLVRARLPLGAP